MELATRALERAPWNATWSPGPRCWPPSGRPRRHRGRPWGLPFARPLVLEFPDDPATWRVRTDWWARERVRGSRWVPAAHGLGAMPPYLREGAVIPVGPDMAWVGERPTDSLTVAVAPFEAEGRAELAVPLDGRKVAVRRQARAGRHRVEVEGRPGELVLDAPAGVELRR